MQREWTRTIHVAVSEAQQDIISSYNFWTEIIFSSQYKEYQDVCNAIMVKEGHSQ